MVSVWGAKTGNLCDEPVKEVRDVFGQSSGMVKKDEESHWYFSSSHPTIVWGDS